MIQAKLLRVVQEQEVERVGGGKPHRVDFRIISATNRDLERETVKKRFRHDLFYRLNVLNVHTPSLRSIPEDIPLLTNHFLKLLPSRPLFGPLKVLPETMEMLMAYHWPGNVRELRNVLARAMLMVDSDTIRPSPYRGELGSQGWIHWLDDTLIRIFAEMPKRI